MANIVRKILSNKLLLIIFILIIFGGGYLAYKYFFGNAATVSYVSAQVKKGILIVSVSASGQVSASNQVDIKSKASGDAVYIGVKNGDVVKRERLLFSL